MTNGDLVLPNRSISTASKLLRAAHALSIPVFVTTQNRARLGATVSELSPLFFGAPVHAIEDKTRFSMWVPAVAAHFPPAGGPRSAVALVGIEAHICVTQTALDVAAAGHRVYVMADGVSSSRPEEVAVALERLRAEPGVTVTTSEAFIYDVMGDAAIEEFRAVSTLIKETARDTDTATKSLLGPRI